MKLSAFSSWISLIAFGVSVGCGGSSKPMSLEKLDSALSSFESVTETSATSQSITASTANATPSSAMTDLSAPGVSQSPTLTRSTSTLSSDISALCRVEQASPSRATISGDQCPVSASIERSGTESAVIVMDIRDVASTAQLDARHLEMQVNISRSGSAVSSAEMNGSIRSRAHGTITFQIQVEPQSTGRVMRMNLSAGGESSYIELFHDRSVHVDGRTLTDAELARVPALRRRLTGTSAS